MKKFKIRAFFNLDQSEFIETEIQGKDLGDAFNKFFKLNQKGFRLITGFITLL